MSNEIERQAGIEPLRSRYTPTEIRLNPIMGGVNYFFDFANGYGASLLVGGMAYGGAEIGILKDGGVCGDTPLSDDGIIPRIRPDTVDSILDEIAALPAPGTSITRLSSSTEE